MLALLILAAPLLQQADATDEIVVVSTRKRKCHVEIANRIVSDSEFKARAAEWAAGKPVRVIVPRGTDIRCQAKIMFELNEHGVVRAIFVDGPPLP